MKCPELARSEIERLQESGIQPTLDELAELIELGNRVENPPRQTNPLASRAPVALGCSGVYLRPLTLQAEAWMELHSGLVGILGASMIGYAAHIGWRAGAFDEIHSAAGIVAAVTAWRDLLTCTPEELDDAADILTGGREPDTMPADGKSRVCIDEILADLVVESGQTAEYWLARSSVETLAAISALGRKRAAMIGASIPDTSGDAARLRDLLWCAEKIRKRAENGA